MFSNNNLCFIYELTVQIIFYELKINRNQSLNGYEKLTRDFNLNINNYNILFKYLRVNSVS